MPYGSAQRHLPNIVRASILSYSEPANDQEPMFSTVQQLCELEHVLSARKLKLTTVSLLKLSLPDENPSPSLRPSQCLTALVPAGTWVARGNGLKITFYLNTEGVSDSNSDRIELTEALAVLLQDAEVIPLLPINSILISLNQCW